MVAIGRLRRLNVHINGCETTVGNGAADGTSKGESGVESKAAQLLGSVGLGRLDDGVNLVLHGTRHCECGLSGREEEGDTKSYKED